MLAALVLALLVESALTRVAPAQARLFDPFLIVIVYCGVSYGETSGMLAGLGGGWIQDVYFGGEVAGLSALTKILIGFTVGVAGSRFLIAGPAQRLLLLFAATVLDTLLFERVALVFDQSVAELSFADLAGRATVTAIVGAGIFELADKRLRQELRS